MEYMVRWEIDIEADTPREAAEKARDVQQDEGAVAHVYEVRQQGSEELIEEIDLDELEGKFG